MIRLHLLGSPRLECTQASGPRSVVSQPRRLALLAYLALRARHGTDRRDRLLGVFWPESDTDHARGALRNALHFLRASLGPEVVRSFGSDEVQLDLDMLWCDAVEFERCCEAGDYGEALHLYSGDLLEGFFISDTPEFEYWLEGERSRLRRYAVDAAQALVAKAEADGELGLMVQWLRRLLQLAPTDEGAARRLMRALAAHDDRGEALRVFGELQERLGSGYGLDVGAETGALADEIRAQAPARTGAGLRDESKPEPPPLATLPVSPPPDAALSLPDAARRESRSPELAADPLATPAVPPAIEWRRRRIALIAATATVLLASMTVSVLLGRSGRVESAPSASVVAVLPFEYRGPAEHAYLAEGMADLLAANLDGAGDLRSVDPRALLAGRQGETRTIDPDAAARRAADHGAGLYVLGSVTAAAGQLRIAAALYGNGRDAPPRSKEVVVQGEPNDVLALVDNLTVGLLEGRGTTHLARAALRTTQSIEALKAFLRGEAALREANVTGAIDYFRRATELDSTFALAHHRLSSTTYWNGISRIPARSAALALRHAGGLAREDSLLIAAWYHHVEGSPAEALRLYDEALWLRPGHVEAEYQRAELVFHWGSTLGVPPAESQEPFRRLLGIEAHRAEAALHLARLAAREGRQREVDSLAARMRHANPGVGWKAEIEGLRAFLSSDTAWQRRTVEAAGVQGARDFALLESMAANSYNLAAVERLVRERLTLERPVDEQARLQLLLLRVQLARGRYHAAAKTAVTAHALPHARRLELRASMAALPFREIAPDELFRLRAELIAHPGEPFNVPGALPGRGVEYPELLWPGMYPPRRLYLLGGLHIALGDMTAAAAAADSLAMLGAAGEPGPPFAVFYERLTHARILTANRRYVPALAELGRVAESPTRTFESHVDYGRIHQRWLRAELLQQTGKTAEAIRWYATFPDPLGRDLPYLAPAHLRRAEIHDAMGERQQAVHHYTRFLELWRDADAELQPLVARAERRLREISGS